MKCENPACNAQVLSTLGACPEHWHLVDPEEQARRYRELLSDDPITAALAAEPAVFVCRPGYSRHARPCGPVIGYDDQCACGCAADEWYCGDPPSDILPSTHAVEASNGG